jgi:hypothetical protein
MKASTTPGRTIFGKGGSKSKVGPATSAPKNANYRVHPVPHARAPMAGKTGPALATYPHNGAGVATAGITSKTFAR